MTDKESQTIEFKSNWQSDHLKVISAFANSNGGILYIGLDDNGKPSGIKNVKKLLEDIPNTIKNKLGIIPSVELEKEEIIKIKISKYSVPISYNGKYYIRSGSTVQELQGKELTDFLIKKTGRAWDNSIEENADYNQIDNNSIEKFKKYAVDRIPSNKN